jgi:hypothetical protein
MALAVGCVRYREWEHRLERYAQSQLTVRTVRGVGKCLTSDVQ